MHNCMSKIQQKQGQWCTMLAFRFDRWALESMDEYLEFKFSVRFRGFRVQN